MRIPLGVQILSLSCSFWENLAKSYVGAPWRVGAPPPGNPGSATGEKYQGVTNNFGRYYGTCMGVLQDVYRGVQPINVDAITIVHSDYFEENSKINYTQNHDHDLR